MGWPRIYTDGKATIAVHQPQVDDWKDFNLLVAHSAIEIIPEKGGKKTVAAVHWKSHTDTNLERRSVILEKPRIESFRVMGETPEKTQELRTLTEKLLPAKTDAIALDRVLAYLDPSRVEPREIKGSTEAPPIIVSTRPAILVMTDGPPIIASISGTKLKYIVNTNWDVIIEDDDYYLLNAPYWLKADGLEEAWKFTKKLPKEFQKIPADKNWEDVRKALKPASPEKNADPPWVYVSEKPAELILLQGDPKFRPIPNTNISDVVNTESPLFFHTVEKNYYFLTAGRWFRNAYLRGTWEFASDRLSLDFAKIPEDDPRAAVRVSVPGTLEALDAVLLASVPQSAIVNRKEAAAQAAVTYVGDPQFKPIPATSLEYATNSPGDVIKAQGKYYLLQDGVWFVSVAPKGPWEVADTIPPEVYKIPPESPKHNVTYVYPAASDSDSVTYAQTAGYLGVTISYGVCMWGTGWYYPPFYYYGPMYGYPIYWGYPYYSYGAAAWYNPATGFYGRGAVAYGPYGGYGRAAAYNPATGSYVRRAGAYGPYQAGSATSFYNARTGAWGAGYRYANPYQGWGQGVVQRGNQWAKGGYYYDDRGAIGRIKTSEGGGLVAAGNGENRGAIARTSDGDLYVGKDGNVYRRDQNGGWSQRNSGAWSPVDSSNLNPEQQQRLNDARTQMEQRDRATNTSQRASREGTRTSSPAAATRGSGASTRDMSRGRPSEMRPTTVDRDVMGGLHRDANARSAGSRNYQSWQSHHGSYSRGGFRGGGFRRR